jgi:hypothetical protein
MPWLRRLESSLSSRRPGFDTGPVNVDFVVDKLTLTQGAGVSYTLVSPVSIIPPVLHTHLSVAGCTCCQQLAVSLCSTLILKNRYNVVSPFVWTVQDLSLFYITDDDGYLRT